MSQKKKSGAKISGDPRKRQEQKKAQIQAEQTRLNALQTELRNQCSADDILSVDENYNDPLNDELLDESDSLAEQFLDAFPKWKNVSSWHVKSQILRAFDAYVMWREDEGISFNLSRCFEQNKVIDVAEDVREFLIQNELWRDASPEQANGKGV